MNNTIDSLAKDIAYKYSEGEGNPTFDPITILTISKIIFDVVIMIKKCYDANNTEEVLEKLKSRTVLQKALLYFIIKKHTSGTNLKSSKINKILLNVDLSLETLNKIMEKS